MNETAWWGSCVNTLHEEQKQIAYAARMGLLADWGCAHPPTYDLDGRSVIDIGGGPASLLLKCVNFGDAVVVDPGAYPLWTAMRYQAHRVRRMVVGGEDIWQEGVFDEAWVYNVLQHVTDPALVIQNARRVARLVRIFDWIEIDPYPGHPHRLEQHQIEQWLGAAGTVEQMDELGAVGKAFYGVFSAATASTLTA